MAKTKTKADPDREHRLNRIRVVTSFATAIVGALVAMSGASLTFWGHNSKDESFQTQLTHLNDTEASLKSLLKFVDDQRNQLQQSEELVGKLKEEHDRLKPVVEADQKVVAAVLAAQAENDKVNRWGERLIGFGFGILGSLVAALIWQGFAWYFRKRQREELAKIV
jgi:hypothetical protein